MNLSWHNKKNGLLVGCLMQFIGLKKRIAFGYLVTGAVAFVIALLSYMAFEQLAADFKKIIRYSSRTADNMAFAGQMAEMQRQALIYIYEGHSSAASQVETIYLKMAENIHRNQNVLHDAGADAVVKLAHKHLDAYYEAFQAVQQQRQQQQRLVKSEFRVHATRAQQLIEMLIRSEGAARLLEYTRLLNTLLQIEKNAYRYFDSFDSDFIKNAAVHIQETRSMLKSFGSTDKTAELEEVLNRYETTFLEAVQRTRGYLYLTCVVMAAQAYETTYQSKKLSALMLAETSRIEEEAFSHIRSQLHLLVLFIGLLLLFIALFSYIVTRSITIPLKQLTGTFRQLAAGSAEAEIPAYQLKDELGELTHAAVSFKEKNIELRASKKELERSNDELEQFVYTVSHDLKSPIVTSMGFIGIIRKLASQGKAEQAMGMLEKVVKANERMSQLINDLLELSRVGRIDMDKKQLDLNELLRDFARNQAERLKAAKFTLIIEPGMPTLHVNESRTLQVFENILSNAFKYVRSEKEGGLLRISSFADAQYCHILCADNGPGIPGEYREKIFGLFYRLDVNAEGTGIGLAVAKKIMKFHGGDIRAEAGSDGGAVFHLTFPNVMNS
ncbi:HAMP domain-containing histidine kinase [Desulfobulbus sp. F3]|nr:HAMP domain-containing histidine kinase [Desulfobulbus sp. F3]